MKALEDRTKQGFMKVKADFKNLNESMQTQQKETDEEQDKKLNEI